MNKIAVIGLAISGLIVLRPASLPGGEEAATPEELHRRAYLLDREGRMALHGEDLPAAYEAFARAVELYRRIVLEHPGWRTEAVEARLESLNREAETIGRRIFSLPEGVVEVEPGMIREGRRYAEGRSDASRVKAAGEGVYQVSAFTVSVVREGPLVGASCTCPDYTYRGKRHGFACKHIWAVVIREGLLE